MVMITLMIVTDDNDYIVYSLHYKHFLHTYYLSGLMLP